jgi:hypothetical protein
METGDSPVLSWLLEGDVSVRYQTHRDLLGSPDEIVLGLRDRIAREGWGRRFLDARDPETGLWGNGLYSPKWISTHYTLLDLKNLGVDPACREYADSAAMLLDRWWPSRGLARENRHSDVCVSAMLLGICCYGALQAPKLREIADYLLERQFSDGGWNCDWENGAVRSSLHTTLSVLEAFRDYEVCGYTYRLDEIRGTVPPAQEFILRKRLFLSARTGEVIDKKMLMLSYPCRWKYDVLRCLSYFASVHRNYDPRMEEALALLLRKRRKNGRWSVQQKYTGRVHFDMEKTGGDSRWNTLRALRALRVYLPEYH